MSIVIEIPDRVMRAMRLPEPEAQARLMRELAVRLYSKQLLGFGKARELAGLTAWEFHDLLAAEGIARSYDLEDLSDDMETLQNNAGFRLSSRVVKCTLDLVGEA